MLETFTELEVQQFFIEVFTFCDFILVFLSIFSEISYKKEKAKLLLLYTIFILRCHNYTLLRLLSINFLFRGIAGIYRSTLIKGLVQLWLVHSLVSQLGYITIPDLNLCTHDSSWLTLNGHMTRLFLWHSITFYLFPFILLVTVTCHSFTLVYKNPLVRS